MHPNNEQTEQQPQGKTQQNKIENTPNTKQEHQKQ